MADRARAVDRIVAAYALVSGAALLFPHRPDGWALVALGHVGLVALALAAARLRPRLAEGSGRLRPFRWVLDWYPLLAIPLLYSELDLLNSAVWGGRYFDAVVLRWEEAVFGGQPGMTLAARLPNLLLSELLHAAYLSYYLIIYVPPVLLYARGERGAFQLVLLGLIATFVLHYVVFIYFPVQGPRYLFPAPGGAIAEGPLYNLTHRVLESGSSRGSAFPSSHMGVAVVQTIIAFRVLPRAAPWILGATAGLGVGAVYGGFHYAIDMAVGAILGALVGLGVIAAATRRGT